MATVHRGPRLRGGHGLAIALGLSIVLGWGLGLTAVASALRPPPDHAGLTLVVYPFGWSDKRAFAAITQAGAQPVGRTWLPFVWLVHDATPGVPARLEAGGAVRVLKDFPFGPTLAGCSGFGAVPLNPLATKAP